MISSSDVNSDFSDIATALTASLAADGQTAITGQLKSSAGANPAYTFAGDTNTGFGSSGPDVAYVIAGGVQALVVTSAGITITGVFSSTITVTGSTASFVAFEGISTDAGAAAGPFLSLYRDSASPAAADLLGQISWYGKDSGGNKTEYGFQHFVVVDPTDGSEDADWLLATLIAGAPTVIIRSSGTQIQIPGSLAVTGNVTAANIKRPTKTYVTASGTYTTPAGCLSIFIQMVGAGGGGGAANTNGGSTGGNTQFDSVVANGGNGGITSGNTGGAGGSGGSGSASLRLTGSGGTGSGTNNTGGTSSTGGNGGSGIFGTGSGLGIVTGGGASKNAGTNTGAGGGGGASGSTAGSGGGAGEYVEFSIVTPAASYAVTIGIGGAGGNAGGNAGGTGGSGLIIVMEFY